MPADLTEGRTPSSALPSILDYGTYIRLRTILLILRGPKLEKLLLKF